jgi:hypothetical protein
MQKGFAALKGQSTAIKNTSKRRRSSFFFVMSLVGLFAVLIGFTKTFFIPVAAGSFQAPFSIHLHGAFAFGWVILFVIQTSLIRFKNYRLHMGLGMLGVFMALGTAITMLPAGIFQVENEGSGPTAMSTIVGVCTSAVIFLSLALAGMIYRKKGAVHKRLMLLATIEVLWVAWWRFRHYFPPVPHEDIWFGVVLPDSLIVIAWIWDKRVNGKVHPVLGYIGAFMIAEDVFEVMTFDNPTWRALGKLPYGFYPLGYRIT